MSQIYEGLEKCVHHLAVREGDGYIQGKILRTGKAAHKESGEPPVPLTSLKQRLVSFLQLHGKPQKLRIFSCLKEGRGIFFRGKETVCMVDADFGSGVNAVLSLP